MKSILWTKHALQNLADREIDQPEVELTVRSPEQIEPDPPGRQIFMRRYYDTVLAKEMLLRVIGIESATAVTVITVYKTSQIKWYLRGKNE